MRTADKRFKVKTPSRPHSGLSKRRERVFRWFAAALVIAMIAGWVFSIIDLAPEPAPEPLAPSRSVTSALLEPGAKTTAFIEDAALTLLTPLHGESGKLKAAFRSPGEDLASGAPSTPVSVRYKTQGGGEVISTEFDAPSQPGIYDMAVQFNRGASRVIDDLKVITLVPFSQKQGGKIGLYNLGSWPFENGGTPKSANYANPEGFIQVTPETQNTLVSEHFRLRDFLTKDQGNVWPKYLLLQPRLLDKLELMITELESRGYRVEHVQIMSGFRTPRYNHGGGNTGGRANLSRHMYGDASDIFVDNDRNGMLDDLNRDGRIDIRDAEVVSAAAEAVERKYPSLVGGIGTYVACCGHGPFTHVDVRGYRARWRGTGNG